tara:strand:- start:111 stop:392 length:282 start_codon:yes stop_codon:yes gene_type:complete
MEIVIFLLCIGIIAGIISVIDAARVRYRVRCRQLRAYITFIEHSRQEVIEDEYDAQEWLNEYYSLREEADIQDAEYRAYRFNKLVNKGKMSIN